MGKKTNTYSSLLIIAKNMAQVAEQYRQATGIIASNTIAMQEQLASTASALTKAVNAFYQASRTSTLPLIEFSQKLREKYEITQKDAINILKKYKWLLSPSMPEVLIFEIVKIGREKGSHRAEINRMFIEHFSKDNYQELLLLVDTWEANPYFVHRMRIFRDCVAVLKSANHKYNPSNVILPTLISQIEGILTAFMQEIGINLKAKASERHKAFRDQTDDDIFSRLSNDILLDILFQSANQGKPLKVPFNFNRHKILHGEITRYGRLDNTLRAFLILDFLHYTSMKKTT